MEERYSVDYEVPTALGNTVIHRYLCRTAEEFEEACENIERIGYKIVLCNYFWKED